MVKEHKEGLDFQTDLEETETMEVPSFLTPSTMKQVHEKTEILEHLKKML